jgi:hypothetical protein
MTHEDPFAAHSEEVSWSVDSEVAILRDLMRPFARPLREISFRQCLHTPSDPPEQVLPMLAARLFLKYLLILLA